MKIEFQQELIVQCTYVCGHFNRIYIKISKNISPDDISYSFVLVSKLFSSVLYRVFKLFTFQLSTWPTANGIKLGNSLEGPLESLQVFFFHTCCLKINMVVRTWQPIRYSDWLNFQTSSSLKSQDLYNSYMIKMFFTWPSTKLCCLYNGHIIITKDRTL